MIESTFISSRQLFRLTHDHIIIRLRNINSLKESVYKALHPILCQYVGFQEAEITPLADGTAKVSLNLLRGSHERLGIVVNTASWRKMGNYFLTSASVGLVPGKS